MIFRLASPVHSTYYYKLPKSAVNISNMERERGINKDVRGILNQPWNPGEGGRLLF